MRKIFRLNRLFAIFVIATLLVAALPSLPQQQGEVEAQGNPYQLTTDQIKARAPKNVSPTINGERLGPESAPHHAEVEGPWEFRTGENVPGAIYAASYGNISRSLESDTTTTGTLARPVSAPQTFGTEFSSIEQDADTGTAIRPPDTMGAVGPTQYITTVNGYIRSHNKFTGAPDGVMDFDDDTFWDIIKTPTGGSIASVGISDPRIRYDRITERWYMLIIDIPFDSGQQVVAVGNRLLMAWSDGPIITGGTVWTYAYYQQDLTAEGDTTNDDGFLDYPTIGIDADSFVVGANMFGPGAGGFVGVTAFVTPMDSLLGSLGGDIGSITYAFRDLYTVGDGYTPHAPDYYEVTPNDQTFFIMAPGTGYGYIPVCQIFNSDWDPLTPGNVPTYGCTSLTALATADPIDAPHNAGAGAPLDTLGDRFYSAYMTEDEIWTAHNVGVNTSGVSQVSGNTRTASRWYVIDISGGHAAASLVQAGTVFDSAATNPNFFIIPTIMVSGQGHAAIGFTQSSAILNPSAAAAGRLVDDAPGTMQAAEIYHTGPHNYPGGNDGGGSTRWGDYSMVSLDPCDDMTMWTIQEYGEIPTLGTYNWSTRVVELLAPPPAVPFVTAAASGSASIVLPLDGDTTNGEGYYDTVSAVADMDSCNTDLVVTIGGGTVTLNGFTWIDADTISLDIDTTGAAPGDNPTITITNPDGQSLTADCWLVIDGVEAPACSQPTPTDTPTVTDTPTDTPTATTTETSTPGGGGGGDPTVTDPGLSKIGILGPGQLGLPGEQITWVITVSNPTANALTNVVISDTLVPELRIDNATTTTGTVSINGQTVTVVIPFLASGASAEIRIVTTVLSNPAAPYFNNNVTLTADGGVFVQATGQVPTVSGLPDTGYPPSDN